MGSIKNVNDLPANVLPDFWGDKERINALYAPFRDKSVNARDWESKLTFWKSLLSAWCKHNQICAFSETELKKYFIRDERAPACLSTVLVEMYKSGDIQAYEDFMEMPQTTWGGWAVDLAFKKPLKWSLSKVKSTFLPPVNDIKYIHKPTVKDISDDVFRTVPDNQRNKLLTIEQLKKICTKVQNMALADFKLLLHYLLCQDKIAIHYGFNNNEHEPNVTLIKFSDVNKRIERVNEIDIGKYKLEQNETFLIKKLEELESEKSEATNTAKAYLAKGMRQMAKNSLRKQHEIDRRIEKQVTVLQNVQTLLDRINHAESDSNVLQSYKKGLEALKTVFKENGLSEDLASDTMLDFEEVLEIHDDIQSTLAQPVTTSLDAELEEELEELLQEEAHDGTPPKGGGSPRKEQVTDELERRFQALKFPDTPKELSDLKDEPKTVPST